MPVLRSASATATAAALAAVAGTAAFVSSPHPGRSDAGRAAVGRGTTAGANTVGIEKGVRALGASVALSAAGAAALAARTLAARRERSSLPLAAPRRAVAVRAFENETGVQPPVGYWDPLGLSSDGSVFTFNRRREVELKHGRVSMFATIGYIVPEYYKLPGFLSPSYGIAFDDVPNGLAALSKVPALGWLQIVTLAGATEVQIYKEQVNGEPGNYGAGFLGCKSVGISSPGFADPEVRKQKLNAELANGRLAMMAIIGMFFQDGLTGSAWGDWANYTDSPLRAFESELGVQAPVGYWDPLGFSKDGDEAKFKRRRASELKHGRICMYATLGYIVPEYFRFPGYLSVSEDLKFADMPSGINGMFATPIAGGLQIFLFMGFLEVGLLRQDPNRAPGDFENIGRLGVPYAEGEVDPESRKRQLNSELANGRLAMVAWLGMIFQNGTVGNTADMWFPSSAFENELGVQAPVGYWDPLGFSKDGDEAKFKRRRASELKHGRICMYATLGYIVPEYFRFPGYLSVSEDLKFADMPSGINGMFATPIAGGLQIFLFMGFLEVGLLRQDPSRAPGDFENIGRLGVPYAEGEVDPESRKRQLNSELANGRLAMVAWLGMIFQNGTVGNTADMWFPSSASERERA